MVKHLHMLVFLLTWKSFTLAVLHPKYISGSSFLKNNLIWLYLSFDIWPIVKNKTCHLLIRKKLSNISYIGIFVGR